MFPENVELVPDKAPVNAPPLSGKKFVPAAAEVR